MSKQADFFSNPDPSGGYQGWSNWDTWNTKLMMDNEEPLYRKYRDLVQNGAGPEQVRDHALRDIIAPHNKDAIDNAKEWNEIPEPERVDQSWEELKKRNPGAARMVDQFGLGEDLSDEEPTLIDHDLVNWDEIHRSLKDELDENAEYEREGERLQGQGLSPDWMTPGHDDAIQHMREAMYRHHGAVPSEELETELGPGYHGDDPRNYFRRNVNVPFDELVNRPGFDLTNHISLDTRNALWSDATERQVQRLQQEYAAKPEFADRDPEWLRGVAEHAWRNTPVREKDKYTRDYDYTDPNVAKVINQDPQWQDTVQNGYNERLHHYTRDYDYTDPNVAKVINQDPQWQDTVQNGYNERLHDYTWDMIHNIHRGQATPAQTQEMQTALTERGHSPEQINDFMAQRRYYEPETGRWIDVNPRTYNPSQEVPDNQPGDLTLPENWTAHVAASDSVIQPNWHEPDYSDEACPHGHSVEPGDKGPYCPTCGETYFRSELAPIQRSLPGLHTAGEVWDEFQKGTGACPKCHHAMDQRGFCTHCGYDEPFHDMQREMNPSCPRCGDELYWRDPTSLGALYPEGAWQCSNTGCYHVFPPGEIAPDTVQDPDQAGDTTFPEHWTSADVWQPEPNLLNPTCPECGGQTAFIGGTGNGEHHSRGYQCAECHKVHWQKDPYTDEEKAEYQRRSHYNLNWICPEGHETSWYSRHPGSQVYCPTCNGYYTTDALEPNMTLFGPDAIEGPSWKDAFKDRMREGKSRSLYHGTLIDNLEPIKSWGVTPEVGKFVQDAYGQDYDEGGDDYPLQDMQPLSFWTDRNNLNKALNAIKHHVGDKLQKNFAAVTPEDIKQHGLLVKMPAQEGERTDRPPLPWLHPDEAGWVETPTQVEPGDYYSDSDQKGVVPIHGSAMMRVFNRAGLFSEPYGMPTPPRPKGWTPGQEQFFDTKPYAQMDSPWMDPPYEESRLYSRRLASNGIEVFTACENGEPAGFAQVALRGREAHVLYVYVDPPHRRQGIGSRLLDEVRQAHPDLKVTTSGKRTVAGAHLWATWERSSLTT